AFIYPVMSFVPPIGLMLLASLMEQLGKQVIVEPMFYRRYQEGDMPAPKTLKKLRDFKPDMIGVGFLSADWTAGKASLKILRSMFGHSLIVAGGRHASNFPQEVLSWGTDFVVIGEGETAMKELLEALERNHAVLAEIPGLAFRNPQGVFSFKPRPVETAPLDVTPAYHLVPYQNFINTRLAIVGRYLKSGWLETSRGCFSKCIYCRDEKFGSHLRWRHLDVVMEDIRVQLRNYDLDTFYIIDDMFAVKEKRVIEFCKRFEDIQNEFQKKLYFTATARTDTLTPLMVEAMTKAGCTQLSIGVESGSQRIHEILKTGKKVDTIRPAFSMLRGTGIDTFINIIIAIPGEEEEDIQKSVDLLKQIKPTTVSVSFLTPYPGTPLYGLALEKGWITEHNSMTFRHSDNFSQLQQSVPQNVFDERKERLYQTSFRNTVFNILYRKEFFELIADMILVFVKRPHLILHLFKSIMNMKVDDFKEMYRELLAEEHLLRDCV
ncbi:MAG: B12-binding domain-containing radical SAM protein, partial [Desulfobacteraceae bacterium]|nr:B12-binding domain-containing radical SAM protein [Desulfobacteraceae bacterium]